MNVEYSNGHSLGALFAGAAAGRQGVVRTAIQTLDGVARRVEAEQRRRRPEVMSAKKAEKKSTVNQLSVNRLIGQVNQSRQRVIQLR